MRGSPERDIIGLGDAVQRYAENRLGGLPGIGFVAGLSETPQRLKYIERDADPLGFAKVH